MFIFQLCPTSWNNSFFCRNMLRDHLISDQLDRRHVVLITHFFSQHCTRFLLQQCASRQNDSNQNVHTNEVYGTPLVWWSRSLGPSSSRDHDDAMIRISVPPKNRGWTTTGWTSLTFLLAGHVTALGSLVTRGLLSDWDRSWTRIRELCDERTEIWWVRETYARSIVHIDTITCATVPEIASRRAADREWSSTTSLAVRRHQRYYIPVSFWPRIPLSVTYVFLYSLNAVNRRVAHESRERKRDRTLTQRVCSRRWRGNTARNAAEKVRRFSARKFQYGCAFAEEWVVLRNGRMASRIKFRW